MEDDAADHMPVTAGVLGTALAVVLAWEALPAPGALGAMQILLAPLVSALVGGYIASLSLAGRPAAGRAVVALTAAAAGLALGTAVELWWMHGGCLGEACGVPVQRAQAILVLAPVWAVFAAAGGLAPAVSDPTPAPGAAPSWRLVWTTWSFVAVVMAAAALGAILAPQVMPGLGDDQAWWVVATAAGGLSVAGLALCVRALRRDRAAPDPGQSPMGPNGP